LGEQGLSATHVVMSMGWHAGLQHVCPVMLPKFDAAAAKWLLPVPVDERHMRTKDQLRLPRVLWESCNERAPHGKDANRRAQEYIFRPQTQTPDSSNNNNNMDYLDVLPLLKRLAELEHLLGQQNFKRVEQAVPRSAQWPAGQPFNGDTIPHIALDLAHFQPWVYNEINSILLNAVCPLKDLKKG
jgi:hypothetical protein